MRIVVSLFLALLATNALAQSDNDKVIKALNEVQGETQSCIAYYTIVKQCIGSRDADLAHKTQAAIDHLINFYFRFGKSIGLTNDAMLSRIEIMTNEQMGLINNNCINISSLYKRHAVRCKQVIENGDSILAEYINR